MPETTQQKFLRLVENIAADKGLSMVVDYKFGNNGFARIQRVTELVSVLTIYFDFQTDNVAFIFTPDLDGIDHTYRQYNELPAVIDAIRAFLNKQ